MAALLGCASTPPGTFGVRDVQVEGQTQIAEQAILNCLLTRPQADWGLTLGMQSSTCGSGDFREQAPRWTLMKSPFADYQGFNPAVIAQDERRLLRFYRARGFYDAELKAVTFEPPYAALAADDRPEDACSPEEETCTVDVTFTVTEGEPLKVATSELLPNPTGLPTELDQGLRRLPIPQVGDRFDEADYDAGKQKLVAYLVEAGYGRAAVEGRIGLNKSEHQVAIRYRIEPGQRFRVGRAHIEGHGVLPEASIVAACGLTPGEYYRGSLLAEVQQHVIDLGAFSTVQVEPQFDESSDRVDLLVKVTPLAKTDFRVGVGIMSGGQMRISTGDLVSYPQWDTHLLLRYERRHIFGTLGRIRIEDRPRLIFQDAFPGTKEPTLGNILLIRNEQPAVLDRHALLVNSLQWDVGPDPYLRFGRHNVQIRTALERPWFTRKLVATLALQQDFYIVASDREPSDGSELPESYQHRFVEQEVRIDLRDLPTDPNQGLYLQLVGREALVLPGADFTTLHTGFDLRGYVPLPLSMVLAARVSMGWLWVYTSRVDDETSSRLGPAPYRLRGGGANGNRGYLAGYLGVGTTGGLRRMESSLELRIRLGSSFGAAFFGDIGDVRDSGPLRLAVTHPTLGFGLRYRTPLGPIRLDMGFRVGRIADSDNRMRYFGAPGALHLTIGESF